MAILLTMYAVIARIGHIDITAGIHLDRAGTGELVIIGALGAEAFHEHAIGREFGDAGAVADAVGDKNVALRVPGHVGRGVEQILLRAGAGQGAVARRPRRSFG